MAALGTEGADQVTRLFQVYLGLHPRQKDLKRKTWKIQVQKRR